MEPQPAHWATLRPLRGEEVQEVQEAKWAEWTGVAQQQLTLMMMMMTMLTAVAVVMIEVDEKEEEEEVDEGNEEEKRRRPPVCYAQWPRWPLAGALCRSCWSRALRRTGNQSHPPTHSRTTATLPAAGHGNTAARGRRGGG